MKSLGLAGTNPCFGVCPLKYISLKSKSAIQMSTKSSKRNCHLTDSDMLTRNLSEKFKVCPIIRHYQLCYSSNKRLLPHFHHYINSNIHQIFRTVVKALLECLHKFSEWSHSRNWRYILNWRCQFIAARRGTVAHLADLAVRSITGCAARHSNASRYKQDISE